MKLVIIVSFFWGVFAVVAENPFEVKPLKFNHKPPSLRLNKPFVNRNERKSLVNPRHLAPTAIRSPVQAPFRIHSPSLSSPPLNGRFVRPLNLLFGFRSNIRKNLRSSANPFGNFFITGSRRPNVEDVRNKKLNRPLPVDINSLPAVYFKKPQDISGYEKFTLDDVIYPEKDAVVNKRQDNEDIADNEKFPDSTLFRETYNSRQPSPLKHIGGDEDVGGEISTVEEKSPTDFELR